MTSARMWEAVVRDRHQRSGEDFCRDVIVPAAQADPACTSAEWFTDGTSRVVVITRWSNADDAGSWAEPASSLPLFDRSHAWVFTVGE